MKMKFIRIILAICFVLNVKSQHVYDNYIEPPNYIEITDANPHRILDTKEQPSPYAHRILDTKEQPSAYVHRILDTKEQPSPYAHRILDAKEQPSPYAHRILDTKEHPSAYVTVNDLNALEAVNKIENADFDELPKTPMNAMIHWENDYFFSTRETLTPNFKSTIDTNIFDVQEKQQPINDINYADEQSDEILDLDYVYGLSDQKYSPDVQDKRYVTDYSTKTDKDSSSAMKDKFLELVNSIDMLQRLYLFQVETDTLMANRRGLKPNVSLQCTQGLQYWRKGVKEMKSWALMMVDSWGKLPNGILEGTFIAPGDFDLCVETSVPERFDGRYCEVSVSGTKDSIEDLRFDPHALQDQSEILPNNSGSLTFITTTICMPSSCSAEDINFLVSHLAQLAKIEFHVSVPQCMVRTSFQYTFSQKLSMTIIITIVVLEFLATAADYRINGSEFDSNKISRRSLLQKIVACLSFRASVNSLFKVDEGADRVEIFNGIKVISIIWLIYSNMYLMNFSVFARKREVMMLMRTFFGQIVTSGSLTIETFFFISGFLLVFLFLKSNSPSQNFFSYVLKQYLKLMIPILFLYGSISFALDNDRGPFWNKTVEEYLRQCPTQWWKLALGIISFSEESVTCLQWIWYVIVDMQLYTAAYFILMLFRKSPKKASRILKLIIALNICFLAARHYSNDLPPNQNMIYLTERERRRYNFVLQTRSSNHIVPYCVGMITGYLVLEWKDIRLPKVIRMCMWSLSAVFFFVSIFSTYVWNNDRAPTTVESTLYFSLFRWLWSIMLGWITFICYRNEGGLVSSLLSRKCYVPLARLTYLAYLVHPIFILVMMGRIRHLFVPKPMLMSQLCTSYTIISYFLAFIFYLTCESPLRRLLQAMFSSSNRQKETNDRRVISAKLNYL